MYLIIAFDQKFGIAANGKIPWSIPEDLSHFAALTKTAPEGEQNAVIMGARTWNATPYFDKRINIVVTTGKTPLIDKSFSPYLASSLKSAEEIARNLNAFRIFVIGGARLLKESSRYVIGSFLTRINGDFSCDIVLPHRFDSEDDKLSFPFPSGSFCYRGDLKTYIEKSEWKYLELLWKVMREGEIRQTRNGVTRSIFSADLEFSLDRFPLLTTKKMFLTGILEELLFFLRGETDTKKLSEKGVRIWEPNTNREFLNKMGLDYPEGYMGPMYGYQWRSYGKPYQEQSGGFDTWKDLIRDLCSDPNSRRLIMTTLNMSQVKEGVLWPCHGLVVQFYVSSDRKLSCKMYQRSADIFLGMPFNIASYAALVHVVCAIVTNLGHPMTPGKLYLSFGDVHIYEEHISAAAQQLIRPAFDFPRLTLSTSVKQVEDINVEDFELTEYTCYPRIPARMIA